MSLAESKIVGFIPCTDLNTAQVFFSETLGLNLSHADDYALEYTLQDARLRVTKVSVLPAAQHTTFGWEVTDINATIKLLTAKGLRFEVFEGMSQSELGICTFPGGSKVAWFKDPDGNTLSITQFESDG